MPRAPILPDIPRDIANEALAYLKSLGLSKDDVADVHGKPSGAARVVCYTNKLSGKPGEFLFAAGNGQRNTDLPKPTDQLLDELLSRSDLPDWLREANLHHADPAGSPSLIHSFTDIPLLSTCEVRPVEYLEETVLPAGALAAITGDAGCGKSHLASAIAGRVAARGIPVLYLDRDNPIAVVQNRFHRLGITDGQFLRIWGGWCSPEPCPLDDPFLLRWVSTCHRKPLIVVDSLGAYLTGDENSAADTRALLRPLRQLTYLGASVMPLHNDGKAETARDYRGSSAFKDALDVGWHVANSKKDGLLDRLTLRCFKNRYGRMDDLVYHYADGRMVAADTGNTTAATAARDYDAELTAVLADNPGINTTAFIAAAAKAGKLSDHRARQFLKDGVAAGTIRRDGSTTTGYCHYLIVDDAPPPTNRPAQPGLTGKGPVPRPRQPV